MKFIGNYINGKWQATGEGSSEVVNKYNGNTLAQLPLATAEQMDEAISAAERAFETLKTWSAGKKAIKLQQLYSLLKENSANFEELIIAEAGKPRSYAKSELNRSLATLKLAIEEAKRFGGDVIPMDFSNAEGRTAFTKRFPLGVVAAITPFNFPLNLLMHKIAPALAVGCSIVVKPPPQAPLTALFLAQLIDQLDYPKGTVNVLHCRTDVAELLVKDSRPKLLTFTGSDKVGWYLKSISGIKKVVLELGGNAATLIDEDVDLQKVAKKVARGTYLYAGQVCISTQRILVHQNIFEAFKTALISEIKLLKVGNPADDDCWVGPLIDKKSFERLKDWVEEAINSGAEVLLGGKVLDESKNIYAPTLLSNTNATMKVHSEEVFAPLATLEKVESFEKGIEAVNDSRYGLQSGVFTNNFSHFRLASNQIIAGGIIFNDVPAFRVDHMPYGGVKDSGIGKEGVQYSMLDMSEERLIVY